MASIRDRIRAFVNAPTEIKEAPQVVLTSARGYHSRRDNYESYASEGY